MEEKIYIVQGIKMDTVGTKNEMVIMTTGAIEGEVEANNWRKYLSTEFDLYFRMAEIRKSAVLYWQAPIDKVLQKSARR